MKFLGTCIVVLLEIGACLAIGGGISVFAVWLANVAKDLLEEIFS